MNKTIVTYILILLSVGIFGQHTSCPIVLVSIGTVEDTCDNKYCVIDFSEKYLLALNYLTQNDSNLQFKTTKVSEKPDWTSHITFFEFLDTEIQKKVFRVDTITNGVYKCAEVHTNFTFDNQRFLLPDSINTDKAAITMFFSKILNNDLFVSFTHCCTEPPHNYDFMSCMSYRLELDCKDIDNNLYYFKFKDNEIDEIYKWIKNESGNGKIVRLK